MKDRTLPAPFRAPEARRLGLSAIILVLLLATFLGGSHLRKEPTREMAAVRQVTAASTVQPSENNFHYFRSGQWLADLRTLVAACQYILQPDSA
jgi:hypothetical protein